MNVWMLLAILWGVSATNGHMAYVAWHKDTWSGGADFTGAIVMCAFFGFVAAIGTIAELFGDE